MTGGGAYEKGVGFGLRGEVLVPELSVRNDALRSGVVKADGTAPDLTSLTSTKVPIGVAEAPILGDPADGQ